jgi:hypothetical protein
MPCRFAVLIREPRISEVTEQPRSQWNHKTKSYDQWVEPLLIPYYVVWLDYDYGFCCGVDGLECTFATREAAQQFIDNIHAGNHEWLRYEPDRIETDE